jgi:hypothetical protein
VNGYANSWFLNPGEICSGNSKCIKNEDGSYDMELVIDFWPQRLFYIGIFVSFLTIAICSTTLIIILMRKNKVLSD